MTLRTTFLRSAPLALLLLAQAAHAGNINCGVSGTSCTAPIAQGSDNARTQGFVGINWTFGQGPDLVVGVRYTKTNSRQRVLGGRLEAVFPFSTSFNSISFDRLRLRAIGGQRSFMQELGLGYSYAANAFLATGAVQVNNASVGTDLIFGTWKWLPYVGVDTLSRPHAAGDGSLSCGSGALTSSASLLQSQGILVLSNQQVNGQTCFLSQNNQAGGVTGSSF
jgi:hypothetical protein